MRLPIAESSLLWYSLTMQNDILNFTDFLTAQIKEKGPMPLSQFIDFALSHPEHGYYVNRDPLGSAGDFTTAPEISQIFGEMIGAWIVDVWMQMGRPKFHLVEFGPGRGTLMSDILRVASQVDGFTDKVQVHFVEVSKTLKSAQMGELASYEVQWHETMKTLPTDRASIVIGNEFLDVLAVEQLRRASQGWEKKAVNIDEHDALFFDWVDADEALTGLLPSKTASHVIYEVSKPRLDYIKKIAAHLKLKGGAALYLDYGHTRSHHGDTLQALRAHEYVDPLIMAGESDLTTHVDFEPLVNAVKEAGLKSPPCVTQGAFLTHLGIAHRIDALKNYANTIRENGQPDQAEEIIYALDSAYNRLTGAEEMGELFKVMCFYHQDALNPAGFSNDTEAQDGGE